MLDVVADVAPCRLQLVLHATWTKAARQGCQIHIYSAEGVAFVDELQQCTAGQTAWAITQVGTCSYNELLRI